MTDLVKTEGGVLVPASKIAVRGVYHGQIIRAGEIVEEFEEPNLVVNEGLNSLLGIMFFGSTQIPTWYLGLYEGNYTPTATVAASTITANSTECTAYVSGSRPTYVPAAPSAQAITNAASPASFTFTATKTVYGAFLVSSGVKSATSGTLFSAALFSSPKSVVSGDQLLLTYAFTASSS